MNFQAIRNVLDDLERHKPSESEMLDLFRPEDKRESEQEECEALSEQSHKSVIEQRTSLDSYLHELEKLQASELIHRARNIDTYLKRMDNNERRAFGQAARREAAVLMEAARKSDRFIPDELPDYYRKQG